MRYSQSRQKVAELLLKVPRRLILTTPRRTLAARLSEAEAIEGAKQGDGDCFEILYGLHKRRVYNLCLRMAGNVEAAEDFTQEAFSNSIAKLQAFAVIPRFRPGYIVLRVNIVLMQFRKKGSLRFPSKRLWISARVMSRRRNLESRIRLLLALLTV